MATDTIDRYAAVDLTEDEAFALLSMCVLSIKTVDDEARSALEKLSAYCKSFLPRAVAAEA